MRSVKACAGLKLVELSLQVQEKTKSVCTGEGFYGPLTDTEVAVRTTAWRFSLLVKLVYQWSQAEVGS